MPTTWRRRVQRRTFGFATHARQMLTVARESFQEIVMSWGGLVLAGMAALAAVSATQIEHMGVPLFATAERITAFLAAPLTSPQEFFGMMVPLLILIYAGELVWREREARLSEIRRCAGPGMGLFPGQVRGTWPGARRAAGAHDGGGDALQVLGHLISRSACTQVLGSGLQRLPPSPCLPSPFTCW